jgi:hypothetical protein
MRGIRASGRGKGADNHLPEVHPRDGRYGRLCWTEYPAGLAQVICTAQEKASSLNLFRRNAGCMTLNRVRRNKARFNHTSASSVALYAPQLLQWISTPCTWSGCARKRTTLHLPQVKSIVWLAASKMGGALMECPTLGTETSLSGRFSRSGIRRLKVEPGTFVYCQMTYFRAACKPFGVSSSRRCPGGRTTGRHDAAQPHRLDRSRFTKLATNLT